MAGRNETHRVDCHSLVNETDKAILVSVKSLDEEINYKEIWFPLSAVNSIHRSAEPYIIVDLWIAKKKRLVI